jgi:hypothetical protein
MEYNEFAANCLQELRILQAKFQEAYNLRSYKQWSYNQVTNLLTFKDDDRELNFRYIEAGSFSEKTATWKWAWDKADTPDSISLNSGSVRNYGEDFNYSKLAEACFASTEAEAWELASITLNIVQGIGVYRAVTADSLQLYLVIAAHIDNEEAQGIKDKYVNCQVHGYGRRAFVCKHLYSDSHVGFEEAFETEENMKFEFEDDDFEAWCDACEQTRQRIEAGEEKVSADPPEAKVVCEKCYFEMKMSNRVKPD